MLLLLLLLSQTGEMYIAASLALVADLTPPHLLVPSTALFMFVVTIIAGNCPLLVPLALNGLMHKSYHTFTIDAAPAPVSSDSSVIGHFSSGSSDSGVGSANVQYFLTERSGHDLQEVMIVTICSLYAASAVIYFLVMLLCPPAPTSDEDDDEDSDDDGECPRVDVSSSSTTMLCKTGSGGQEGNSGSFFAQTAAVAQRQKHED